MPWTKKKLIFNGAAALALSTAGAAAYATTDSFDRLSQWASELFSNTKPDAIVAFAGGPNRVRRTFDLATDQDQKIFISGSAPQTRLRDTLAALHMNKAPVPAQNIEYGRCAITTVGNAIETAEWLKANPDIRRITIVTSFEHVDRAESEMDYWMKRLKVENVKVHFHGVRNPDATRGSIFQERQKAACASVPVCREKNGLNDYEGNMRPAF